MEVCDQLHAPVDLPPRKELRYTLYRRFGGPRAGLDADKSLLSLPESNPEFYAVQHNAIPTKLNTTISNTTASYMKMHRYVDMYILVFYSERRRI
jgi:hypothetical protein